ncbi:MAG: hypothetical protein C0622_03725 [Desulfuromonas sp.]|nr:MAG: hypothetical protein C0622_03725 [Desulfuromonas sp.]
MKKENFVKAYLKTRPLPIDDIARARKLEAERSALAARVSFAGTIDDINIDTAEGRSRVRVYSPPGKGPFPLILYMHGGGFSIGSPDTSDNLCRTLSTAVKAVILSIDYALAPENKFPTALEECHRVATWALDNDVALNIRYDQLAVVGDSAGGNLAAALCLLARERRDFTPLYQVLICPLLDQQTELSAKISQNSDPLLTSAHRETFSRYYFSDRSEAAQPLASPLLAKDLSGLPPATIISAELDPLAAEAIAYSERLQAAGVSTTLRHYPGLVHDFPLFVKALEEAREAAQAIADDLISAFTTP